MTIAPPWPPTLAILLELQQTASIAQTCDLKNGTHDQHDLKKEAERKKTYLEIVPLYLAVAEESFPEGFAAEVQAMQQVADRMQPAAEQQAALHAT